MALSKINFKNGKSLQLGENGPIMQVLRQPQIMHVKFTGRSTFFKQKQYNERIQDEWRKANPRIARPKQQTQSLNTEMTRDEFLKQEREKAESRKKK
jgi:hypothetical protein